MLTLHIPSFIWKAISLKSYMIQLPVEFLYFLLFLISIYIISADINFTVFLRTLFNITVN